MYYLNNIKELKQKIKSYYEENKAKIIAKQKEYNDSKTLEF